MKLYDFNSTLDFGQHKGEELNNVFEKNSKYIDWCFQKVDYFCVTDELFNKLPIVEFLKLQTDSNSKDLLSNLKNKHQNKKNSLERFEKGERNYHNKYSHDQDYDENNWLRDASGTDDPDTMNDVYWNLD